MKVLIAYASHSGTAAECAELLRKQLDGLDVTVVDLMRESPNAAAYDAVVVGGSVRFGKADRRFVAFLEKDRESLLARPLGLFLCCGDISYFDDYTARCIPEEILRHAFLTECFGGSLDPCRFRGLEKIAVHYMRSSILNSTEHDEGQYEKTLPALLPENVGRMATHLRTALRQTRERGDGE